MPWATPGGALLDLQYCAAKGNLLQMHNLSIGPDGERTESLAAGDPQ